MKLTYSLAVSLILAVAAFIWSVFVLSHYITLSSYQDMLKARNIQKTVQNARLEPAIHYYQNWSADFPCYRNASLEQAKLTLIYAERLLLEQRDDEYQQALASAYQNIRQHLRCSPLDAKGWIDLAYLSLELQGYGPESEQAILYAARLSANEGWLAEKRIIFAMSLGYDMPPKLHKMAQADVKTLQRGLGYRERLLLQRMKLKTREELLQKLQLYPHAGAGQPGK